MEKAEPIAVGAASTAGVRRKRTAFVGGAPRRRGRRSALLSVDRNREVRGPIAVQFFDYGGGGNFS